MNPADRIHALIGDDWDTITTVDEFLWIFDHLPRKMRMIVDFRIQGMDKKDIAGLMKIKEASISKILYRAKMRFIKSLL